MIRFKFEDGPAILCSIDPITLTGLAVGALAGGGAALAAGAGAGGGAPAPAPAPPPSMAPPQQGPTGTKATPQSSQPSFVGQAAVPSSNSGQKTLLGQ